MADSADLRSEGKFSNAPLAITAREKRYRLIASGTCIYCAAVAVKNRTVCYACSEKQGAFQRMYGFRAVLKNHGIDDPGIAVIELQKLVTKTNNKVLMSLLTALRAGVRSPRGPRGPYNKSKS